MKTIPIKSLFLLIYRKAYTYLHQCLYIYIYTYDGLEHSMSVD